MSVIAEQQVLKTATEHHFPLDFNKNIAPKNKHFQKKQKKPEQK